LHCQGDGQCLIFLLCPVFKRQKGGTAQVGIVSPRTSYFSGYNVFTVPLLYQVSTADVIDATPIALVGHSRDRECLFSTMLEVCSDRQSS
jgi:hypothetical protein